MTTKFVEVLGLRAEDIVMLYGKEIILSDGMQSTKKYIQHGDTSVYEHCINVACLCVLIATCFHIKVNQRNLVRGALLHDYFLYDWHVTDNSHKWHGFTHPRTALRNARKSFKLNKIERDMILRHMFPLNITPPRYKESIILCLSDKIYAIFETFHIKKFNFKVGE